MPLPSYRQNHMGIPRLYADALDSHGGNDIPLLIYHNGRLASLFSQGELILADKQKIELPQPASQTKSFSTSQLPERIERVNPKCFFTERRFRMAPHA